MGQIVIRTQKAERHAGQNTEQAFENNVQTSPEERP
jgi:hypothetical protein